MATPKRERAPTTTELTVVIDPAEPRSATIEVSTPKFQFRFVTTRAMVRQLRERITAELKGAPFSPVQTRK